MNVKKILITAAAGSVILGASILPTFAETLPTIEFEGYTVGTINGQDGWTSLGADGSGCAVYDHAVGDSLGTSGFGLQSLRISNAVTSGCFGDQTFAKPLTDAVGEADSTNGSYSPGTLQPHFEMEFDVASTMPNGQQPGLFVSVSPDRGDGSRMSYIGFEDVEGGINIIFYDVQGENPGLQTANFVLTNLGTYDRTIPHHIKLTMDMADGASNDVVNVYIDGDLKHTGTSWENYFRFDTEASAEQSPRIVKTAIFRTGGSSAPDTAGKGFLFDNVSLTSGETPTEPTPTPNPLIPAECAGMDLNGEVIIGTGKSETLNGTNKNDLIIAKGGSDKINGKNGDDCIVAGGGGDTVHGNNGNDIILGNAGADSLYGDNGEDTIYGQGGADNMDGGNGKDTLIGGGASDYARGGNGKDMCIAEAKVSCEL